MYQIVDSCIRFLPGHWESMLSLLANNQWGDKMLYVLSEGHDNEDKVPCPRALLPLPSKFWQKGDSHYTIKTKFQTSLECTCRSSKLGWNGLMIYLAVKIPITLWLLNQIRWGFHPAADNQL